MTVIGQVGCGKCIMIKNQLTKQGVDFYYILFNDMPQDKKDELIAKATQAGQTTFPIIIKDDKIVTLQEVGQ